MGADTPEVVRTLAEVLRDGRFIEWLQAELTGTSIVPVSPNASSDGHDEAQDQAPGYQPDRSYGPAA